MCDKVTSKDYYFDSYAHFGIHEEMLKDEVRTLSYMRSIEDNKHLFKGKIVLDVGCGTGILSMFAVRAGAAKVFAVECSEIVEQTRQIIEENDMTDKIEVIRGKMEEIELPVEKVDIIISEWMGYFLLYESMLETVMFARDKYLVPGGLILPDRAILYISGVFDEYRREKIDFWNNVYGFKMKCIQEVALSEPVVESYESRSVLSSAIPILDLNICNCNEKDLQFSSEFELIFQRNDYCNGLITHFDCGFTQIHKPYFFSTSPHSRYTHWKQTAFYFTEVLTVCAGESLKGIITVYKNERNPRDLEIKIKIDFDGSCMKSTQERLYHLR